MESITVTVPVGPQKVYRKYLPDCIISIQEQMLPGDEILVIDDMAGLTAVDVLGCRLHYNPWLLGCADSWNIGVSLADNEWVILMGSDDKLLPGALDACREVLMDKPDPLGFYNLSCQVDTGEVVTAHNNAAMVSKALWELTGGFPPSAGVGGPDALLISIMMVHLPDHLHQIGGGSPFYWVRTHPEQDTRRQAMVFHSEVLSIRDKETKRWVPRR